MSLRKIVFVLAMGLAACVAPVPQAAQPGATGPVGQVAPAPVRFDANTTDPRAMARNFVNVVNAVEPIAERECRMRNPRLNCDFRIVVDDRPGMPPNAFQTIDQSGRPIIAFTLSLIGDVRNGDELAFVMAHEAAHHIAGHLERQRQNASIGAAIFGQLAGVGGGSNAESVRVAQQLGAAVGARSYSQDFELEADALGTIIAARAGFNPLRGAEYFFRVPDPGSRFLSTHPPNAARIAIVQRTAANMGL